MWARTVVFVAGVVSVAADANAEGAADSSVLVQVGGRIIVDLSHTLAMDKMPIAEGGSPIEMILEQHDDGFGARSEFYEFCLDEKLGTHVNAPSMYSHVNGSLTSDKLPLGALVAVPGVVIDLSASSSRSAHLGVADVLRWEERHGRRVPAGALVLLRTGWHRHFHHPDKFLGHFADENRQVFPGFSPEAALFLLDDRDVSGLGTECIDVELGWSTLNEVKHAVADRGKISVVQLTRLDLLPEVGAEITIAPIKLRGGAGGSARVFATFPAHGHAHGHAHRGLAHHPRHRDLDDEDDDASPESRKHVRRLEPWTSRPDSDPAAAASPPVRVSFVPPSEQTLTQRSASAASSSFSAAASDTFKVAVAVACAFTAVIY